MTARRGNAMATVRRDPKSGVLVAVLEDDVGTPERARHALGVEVGRHFILDDTQRISSRQGARAVGESLFDRIVSLGGVDTPLPSGVRETPEAAHRRSSERAARIDAAGWLLALYQRTGISPVLTGSYQAAVSSDRAHEPTDDEAASRAVLNSVWRGIGVTHASIIVAIICHQEVPRRATPDKLRTALDALAMWLGKKGDR